MNYDQILRSGSPATCILSWMCLGLFLVGAASAQPHIAGADLAIVAEGEWITLSGSGFSTTDRVRFIFGDEGDAATFEVISDEVLKVRMPSLRSSDIVYALLIETAAGSTVGIPPGWYEHTEVGPIDWKHSHAPLVIKAGALPTEIIESEVILVEAGGVLEVSDDLVAVMKIFAENGATLDFTGVGEWWSETHVFYSPETVLIGEIPTSMVTEKPIGVEVPPLLPSFNIEYFGPGVPINIAIVGDGIVTTNPDRPYFERYEWVELSAVAGGGSTFSGWTGDVNSTDPVVRVRVTPDPVREVTATFSKGWLLDLYAIPGVEVTVSPEKSVYSDGESVVLTARVLDGFTFLGWSGYPDASSTSLSLTLDGNKRMLPVVRPASVVPSPVAEGLAFPFVPVGESVSIFGRDLTDTEQIFLVGSGQRLTASFDAVSDRSLELEMPAVRSAFDEYMLVIQGLGGTSVGIPDEVYALGVGESLDDEQHDGPVVVQSGGVLRGQVWNEWVYVETGGVFEISDEMAGVQAVFLEDGAVLDFGEKDPEMWDTFVFFSPHALIINGPPTDSWLFVNYFLEVPSIDRAVGMDMIAMGYTVEVGVLGDGTVSISPDYPYFRPLEELTFRAFPENESRFVGWSGAIHSSVPAVTLRLNEDALALTANFVHGWLLETYALPGAIQTISPRKTSYEDGETVTVSIEPEEGIEFLGWVGDFVGSELSIELTMDSDVRLIPILKQRGEVGLPKIVSADHTYVPAGETIDLTGLRLDLIETLSLVGGGEEISCEFSMMSDTSVAWTMPFGLSDAVDHVLLAEHNAGVIVGLPVDHLKVAASTVWEEPVHRPVIVAPGAVFRGEYEGSFMYVESGGVLELSNSMPNVDAIFLEDGAVLDARSAGSQSAGRLVFRSPNSLILEASSGVSAGEEMSIYAKGCVSSTGALGPFGIGYELGVEIEGPGDVLVDPLLDYYRSGDSVALKAVPDPDSFFIRWLGTVSGHAAEEDLFIFSDERVIARFSDQPDYFHSWRSRYFSSEESADLTISGFDADPDGDGLSNTAEYAFGFDPRVANESSALEVSLVDSAESTEYRLTYKRPLRALDVDVRVLLSSDLSAWESEADGRFKSEEMSVELIDEFYERVSIRVIGDDAWPSVVFFRLTAEIF